jgi:hypothetical protein
MILSPHRATITLTTPIRRSSGTLIIHVVTSNLVSGHIFLCSSKLNIYDDFTRPYELLVIFLASTVPFDIPRKKVHKSTVDADIGTRVNQLLRRSSLEVVLQCPQLVHYRAGRCARFSLGSSSVTM